MDAVRLANSTPAEKRDPVRSITSTDDAAQSTLLKKPAGDMIVTEINDAFAL